MHSNAPPPLALRPSLLPPLTSLTPCGALPHNHCLIWATHAGVDTLLRDEGETLSEVARSAAREKRIVLTRDRKVLELSLA